MQLAFPNTHDAPAGLLERASDDSISRGGLRKLRYLLSKLFVSIRVY